MRGVSFSLDAMPLTARDDANNASACIFLSYCARGEPLARRKLRALIKDRYREVSGDLPGQSYFLRSISPRRISVAGPPPLHEPSASLQHGCCGQISRTLHAGPLTSRRRSRVGALVRELDGLRFEKNGRVSWPSYFRSSPQGSVFPGLSLSLHNGLGGAIAILSLCWTLEVEKKICARLLAGAVQQVLDVERAYGGVGLPAFCGHPELKHVEARRSTAIYGDAAMGYAIAVAGRRCGVASWARCGAFIFKRGLAKTPRQARVFGNGIATGAIGLSHLAYRYHQMTGDSTVLAHGLRWRAHAERLYAMSSGRGGPTFRGARHERNHLFNSVLGYWLARWFQDGAIDGRWDSLFGLSNPVSGRVA